MPAKRQKRTAQGRKPSSVVSAERAVLAALTQESAAKLLAVSPSALRSMREAPRRPDGRYDLFALLPWYIRRQQALANPSDDPLLEGGDESPALERYRVLRGDLLEIELGRQRGSLMPADAVVELIDRWTAIMRPCHEELRDQFGEVAAKIFEDRIYECDRLTVELFSGQPPEPAAAAENQLEPTP